MLTDVEERMNELVDNINVHGAILIIGAGSSFESGMPLYAQFYPIIWRILDAYPELKSSMDYDPLLSAKSQVVESYNTLKKFFDVLELNEDALKEFQKVFLAINDSHQHNVSQFHVFLSKLIHSGLVKLVVSLNWDDLLETAWEKLYGTDINSNKIQLLKPHGSVREINQKWTLPNSDGKITDDELQVIRQIQGEMPITTIIVGYSESDRIIVEKIILPSNDQNKVFRISPNAEDSIALKTSVAFELLQERIILKKNDFLEHVDYSNQVGLEHAIMGYRLLPSDVSACARLPQINDISLRLTQAHSVIIKGEPGCGKSITAYQVAHDFMQSNWEVVKIKKLNTDIMLNNDGYKTIYLLDDAQQYDECHVFSLLNKANKNNKVIVTQTLSETNNSESVVITQSEAVGAIYRHYLEKIDEVIEIVREPNKRIGRDIGNLHMEIPPQVILDAALKEKTPWLFNYSLRGGWAETRNQYNIAKEYKNSSVLLVIISLY